MNRIVKLSYYNLINKRNKNLIHDAFCNKNSLGAILITDIPNFYKHKFDFFKIGKQFAENKEIHYKYELEHLNYSYGWSCGKEYIKKNQPDFYKGSFYANPLINHKNNIWPEEYPEFEYYFNNLSKIMYYIGLNVILDCDYYLNDNIVNYPKEYLYNIIKNNNNQTGRFLHYYENNNHIEEDGSCAWHLDHGGLTILPSAIYFDNDFNRIFPNDDSGLYIKDTNENIHKITIPDDSVLCQSGEILQILSGGFLKATPHCVKSTSNPKISRETFPLFIDCKDNYNISLPKWSKNSVLNTPLLNNESHLYKRYYGTKLYKDFVNNTYNYYYKGT